jgi:hypothetical protein
LLKNNLVFFLNKILYSNRLESYEEQLIDEEQEDTSAERIDDISYEENDDNKPVYGDDTPQSSSS